MESNSELANVMSRLDVILGGVVSQIDCLQTRLISVTRDHNPKAGGGEGASPPQQAGSQVVNQLRDYCERGERMNLQIADILDRLEV